MTVRLSMKVYHWVYIVLVMVISAVHVMTTLLEASTGLVSQFLPVLIATVLICGIVGKATHQPLLFRWFWLVSFWLILIGTVMLFGFNGYLLWQQGISASIKVTLLLFTIAAIVPGLLALYQYAYLSPDIWQQRNIN